jgi:hypothetical protein
MKCYTGPRTSFLLEIVHEIVHLQHLGLDVKIILKWDLNKLGSELASYGSSWNPEARHGNEPSDSL